MADKLDWMNKHLVFLRHTDLNDVVEQEKYKIRPDLAGFFSGTTHAETIVFNFAKAGRYKEACEFMAYIAHRRAAVWWGYRCVLSLLEELKQNPPVDVDLSTIGGDFTPAVPDFAKVELPEPKTEQEEELKQKVEELFALNDTLKAQIDPKMLKFVEDAVEVAFQEFKQVHGIHPVELLKKLGERMKEPPNQIDPNSPIFVESKKLKQQIMNIRKDAVDTIQSVIPPKVPEHEKKLRDNVLDGVYRWVVSPDEENSQKCLDMGNECPETPAGLLSLSAFWAGGNLMPGGEQVVPTPPGLAANGLCQVLLNSSLHKGGYRKVKERYEVYFNLGLDVLTGKDNWEEYLVDGKPPHREDFRAGGAPQKSRPAVQPQPDGDSPYRPPFRPAEKPAAPQTTYTRWKAPDQP